MPSSNDGSHQLKQRVLIVDSYSSSNRGDAAILSGLLASLDANLQEAEFVVHSPYYRVTTQMHNVVARPPLVGEMPTWRWQIAYLPLVIWLWLAAILERNGVRACRFLPPGKRLIFADFSSADLIVGAGGGFYNDNYVSWLPSRLFHLWLGKVLGKPVTISAHSIGPFNRSLYRRLAYLVFSHLDLICVRDRGSLAQLSGLGVQGPQIELVGDTAWLIEGSSSAEAREILEKEGVPLDGKPLVIMTGRVWQFYRLQNSQAGHQTYVQVLARVAAQLTKDLGARVLFASTCTGLGGYPHDDRRTGEQIRSQALELGGDMYVLKGEYTPEQLKGIYGLAWIAISTRMHSIILTASQGVPMVGIAYEHKTYDLMDALELGDFVLDIETLSFDELWSIITRMLSNRSTLADRLLARSHSLRRAAARNTELIASLLIESGRRPV
jgi:polysaccharide pyruvyl transferase WcaK-like protein